MSDLPSKDLFALHFLAKSRKGRHAQHAKATLIEWSPLMSPMGRAIGRLILSGKTPKGRYAKTAKAIMRLADARGAAFGATQPFYSNIAKERTRALKAKNEVGSVFEAQFPVKP